MRNREYVSAGACGQPQPPGPALVGLMYGGSMPDLFSDDF